MIPDRYGALHGDCAPVALAAYETAAGEFLRHRSPMPSLLHALALDPGHTGALALKRFCNILLARAETIAQARALHVDLSVHVRSGRDTAMCLALGHCCNDRMDLAISCLRDYLVICPADIVVIKMVHALQFMSGAGRDMAGFTRRCLPGLDSATSGFGYVMGCHAFALEEAGDFVEAEAAAQAALHRDGRDLWAMHALAHVYEMSGRNREGIIWIESARDLWFDSGSFGFHLAWHLALFNLNIGKPDRALAIYDRDVRSTRTEDFRDIANAVSLLWRLRQEGIDTGSRFEELAEIARRHKADTSLVFASLHDLMALLATGDIDAAHLLICALRKKTESQSGTQANVAGKIGLPLALALVRSTEGKDRRALSEILSAISLRDLSLLGGSNAQRDVFLRSLAVMATQSGERILLDRILGFRHEMRRADMFLHKLETLARGKHAAGQTLGHAA